MPRGKKGKGRKDYAPATNDDLESGVVVPLSRVPKDIRDAFVSADAADAAEETAKAEATDNFAGSEFVDGVGDVTDSAQPTPKPASSEGLPLPKRANQQPPAAMPQPDVIAASWQPPVIPPEHETLNGDLVATISPSIPPLSEDGNRRHLTWIVTKVTMSTTRAADGRLTADITVAAMLAAVVIRPVAVSSDPNSTKEPTIDVQHLLEAPVGIKLPLWLFPPEKQRRPDTISIAEASTCLVSLFATLPFEIIRPAPLPRAVAAAPGWLRDKILQQGAKV